MRPRRYNHKLLDRCCRGSSSGRGWLQYHASLCPSFSFFPYSPQCWTQIYCLGPWGNKPTLKMAGWKDPDNITELPHQPQPASCLLTVMKKIRPQFVLQVTVFKSPNSISKTTDHKYILHVSITWNHEMLLWEHSFKKQNMANLRCPKAKALPWEILWTAKQERTNAAADTPPHPPTPHRSHVPWKQLNCFVVWCRGENKWKWCCCPVTSSKYPGSLVFLSDSWSRSRRDYLCQFSST